jgi:hypothetical protein
MVACCSLVCKTASASVSYMQLEEIKSKSKFNGLPAELLFHLSEDEILNGKAEEENAI